ncbi:LAETG motif-containing sortase-dependent surface protein [Streptomyces sp. NPDC014894]|uniref:LAETG motif-containing sortase-dependent surface protein n=1 Tax=unclassified Streptomyces TaxID=2593676 RepID=UPI0036FCE710
MSVARRPLLTATAAGTLLCALWFVPSANASADPGAAERQRTGADTTSQQLQLAETGGFDSTPYLIGGTAFLGVGIGFVTYAVRRRENLGL